MSEQLKNTLDWDWTATVPLQHLSLIMHSILPPAHLKPNPHLEAQVQELISTKTTDSSLELIGNAFEGIIFPTLCRRSDGKVFIDNPSSPLSLVVLNDRSVGKEGGDRQLYAHFQNNGVHPGFVRLTKLDPDRFTAPVAGNHFVSAEKISDMRINSHVSQDKQCLVYSDHTELDLQQILNRQTIAFPCPEWPSEAEAWRKRQRKSKWPSQDLVEEIVKSGCHVIPGAHPSSKNREIEWGFSFASAQKKLAQTFTPSQRHCFLLFKMLYYDYLDLPTFITPDHLLTLFLWECEKIPQEEWAGLNIATIFLALIDKLLYAVIEGELSDYFIPEYNTIDFIPEDFEFHLMDKISRLRQDPLTHLLNFASIYRFSFSPSEEWKTLSKPLLEDIQELHEDQSRSTVKAFLPFADKLAACFLKETKDKEVLHAYQFIASVFLQGRLRVLDLFSSAHQRVGEDLNLCIQLMELSKREFPDNKHMYSLLGNLGCMYHSLANRSPAGSEKREKMLKKAEEQFGLALACPEASGATRMDYCNFLCNARGQYVDAIPDLLRIIEAEKERPQSGNAYDSAEVGNVDENLQLEIQASETNSVTVLSVMYAFYMLIKAYLQIGEDEPALATLKEFHDCVHGILREKITDVEEIAISFNLLGYSYMRLADKDGYKKAEAAFNMALTCKPNYALAEEKRDECKALVLSLIGPDEQEEVEEEVIPHKDGEPEPGAQSSGCQTGCNSESANAQQEEVLDLVQTLLGDMIYDLD
ncbi:uncharacterized protein LOC106164043 [Lingula anatina]|uniref:Uncharacterized protein LOC106164043 n=1 Tax=Lingula anatina TaxID=7574 RepID=A0A1S3IGB1_LINAN|nr:uncharacterized protein LOC106164043 [Lingula anatina]|eukprot:XP_013397257.1 uncharacterized protein LOC106164043 [Lingula anatina]